MNLLSENRVSLSALARQEKVAPSTIWRWTLNGVRGVRLETISIGARRYTTREAFARFVEGTTAAAANQPMPSVRTNRQRQRAIDRAEAELDAAGI